MCIRTTMPNRPGFVFVEGAIVDVQNDTKTYTVHLLNGKRDNVKRAHIRLLRPPWWDELNDTGAEVAQTRVHSANDHATYPSNKKPYASSSNRGGASAIIYNNNRGHMDVGGSSRLKYSSRVDATGTPLQLHQVIPTIQVS